jgi:large repetitive protein
MKKPTFSRIVLLAVFVLFAIQSSGQNFVPFTPRFDKTLKGDMLLIGNNILSVHPTNSFNSTGTGVNNTFPDNGSNANNNYNTAPKYLVNVDIDADASNLLQNCICGPLLGFGSCWIDT